MNSDPGGPHQALQNTPPPQAPHFPLHSQTHAETHCSIHQWSIRQKVRMPHTALSELRGSHKDFVTNSLSVRLLWQTRRPGSIRIRAAWLARRYQITWWTEAGKWQREKKKNQNALNFGSSSILMVLQWFYEENTAPVCRWWEMV